MAAKRQRTTISWGRVLRRGAALFMATVAAWLALLGAGAGAAGSAVSALGESPSFVAAALRMELGTAEEAGTPLEELGTWGRLVVGQSPWLTGGLLGAEAGGGTEEESEPLPAGQPAPDHDDISEPPAATAAPGNIVAQTLIPTSTQGYDYADGVYLYNRTDLSVDLAALTAAPVEITLDRDAPQVLIVHTHGTEAYTPDGEDVYTPSDNNTRTLDEHYNMVRVGDEIERIFTEMGLSVIHDRTLYDYPAYNGAYDRSKAAVEQWLAEYPTIQVVLDVHRDALVGSNGEVYKLVSTEAEQKVAQVMLVVGTDDNGANHPGWKNNLAFAVALQKELVRGYSSLARPIVLRSSSYNQQLRPGYLLVEVGGHGNTLTEAIAGARMWADNVARTLTSLGS